MNQPVKATTKSARFQRIVSVITISIISFVGLEALVYINNLYQNQVYIMASGYIYLIMLIWLYFLFDLHFKEADIGGMGVWKAIGRRFKYFASWDHFRYFQNHLIMPGILYWGAIILIGINFGHHKLQQFIAVVTSFCLVVSYGLFKEVFHNRLMPISNNHFVLLSYVKIFASWLAYAGSLGIVWYYCFPPHVFYFFTFMVTLMLLYQALFQLSEYKAKYLGNILAVSAFMTIISYYVFQNWNVNYFSAGLFMTAVYNFFWNMLHHSIRKTLTAQIFLEQLAILALIIIMVFGVTNFNAKIDRCVF